MATIEQAELQEINELRTKLANVVSDTGQTTLQIQLMTSDIEALQSKLKEQTEQFKELLSTEQNLVNRLLEKYGTGSINFETGEFTPEN